MLPKYIICPENPFLTLRPRQSKFEPVDSFFYFCSGGKNEKQLTAAWQASYFGECGFIDKRSQAQLLLL